MPAHRKDPRDRKERFCLALPQWLLEWLDAQPASRAVTIEQALRQVHDLAPPHRSAESTESPGP